MTIGATLKIGGNPILIADLMVSTSGFSGKHAPLPTHPDVNFFLPEESQRLVAGLARKTIQFGNKTVICASGNLIGISKLFRAFRQKLPTTKVTINKVESVFSSTYLGENNVDICGWSIDESTGKLEQFKLPQCKSGNEKKFHAIGSGAREFLGFYQEIKAQGIIDTKSTNIRAQALQVAGQFIGNQQFFGFGIESLMGGGIEVFVYNGENFELIDNIEFLSFILKGNLLQLPPLLIWQQTKIGNRLIINSNYSHPKYQSSNWFCVNSLGVQNRPTFSKLQRKAPNLPQPKWFLVYCAEMNTETDQVGVLSISLYDEKNSTFKIVRKEGRVGLEFHGPSLQKLFSRYISEMKLTQ